MSYQYKREPLTACEATRLANECRTEKERLVIWTLLDSGLRLGELAQIRKTNVDRDQHRITVYGKGGPYGSMSRRRVLPLSYRTRPLVEAHFDNYDTLGISRRTIQRVVKKVADRASIARHGRASWVVTVIRSMAASVRGTRATTARGLGACRLRVVRVAQSPMARRALPAQFVLMESVR